MSRLFLIVALVMAKSLLVGALGSVVPYRLQWPIPATAAERWSDWHVAMGRSPVKRSEFVRSSDKCSRGRRRPRGGEAPGATEATLGDPFTGRGRDAFAQ
jgi:hypothetical protein